MKTLSILKHQKQFTDSVDEVELIADEKSGEFLVRTKFSHMITSKFQTYRKSTDARYDFLRTCMFILS